LLSPQQPENVREQVSWVIGNLLADDHCREEVDISIAISCLLGYLNSLSIIDAPANGDMLRRQKVAGWALSNSIRGKTPGNLLISFGLHIVA
jgi:hypothetical protein